MPKLERLDKKPDYDGQEKYELPIDTTDAFTVYPIRSKYGKYGLHVQNQKCDNVLSLWGLTEQQLRDLHDEIARTLGLPSAISPDVLRNLHRTLTEVLDAHDRAEANRPGPCDEMPPKHDRHRTRQTKRPEVRP